MKTNDTRNIILFIIFVILLFVLSGCKVPQSTPEPKTVDTIFTARIDSFYIEEPTALGEWEFTPCDNVKPCPPTTVIQARKVKRSGNIDNSISIELKNCFNENNDLKKSNQVFKSQVDSLTMIANKGTGTSNGSKWWIFVLLGIAIGSTATIAGRLLIKKAV